MTEELALDIIGLIFLFFLILTLFVLIAISLYIHIKERQENNIENKVKNKYEKTIETLNKDIDRLNKKIIEYETLVLYLGGHNNENK